MNQREVGTDRFRRLAGVAKDSFRIRAKADSAGRFAMFELSCGNCLGVLGGSTGQSASFKTCAVVEPSNVRRKKPAWVGMMMRSNLLVRAR